MTRFFKQFNDYYGHVEGDMALKKVAEAIEQCVNNETALVARYGGEEFAVVLPQFNQIAADKLAKEICQRIEGLCILHTKSPVKDVVSVSCGVATLMPGKENDILQLVEFADRALYEAKNKGRDQIVLFNHVPL